LKGGKGGIGDSSGSAANACGLGSPQIRLGRSGRSLPVSQLWILLRAGMRAGRECLYSRAP
jgi:hypothetical protein